MAPRREADERRAARRVIAGVLDARERAEVALRFGVAEEQVVRDHAISHALAAMAGASSDDLVFFGGTALARTHLTGLRLSEDIDLIALGSRVEIGDRIEEAVGGGLGRTLGAVTFTPHLRDTVHSEPSVMEVGGIRIQVQLLSSVGYPAWPTEVVDLEQRYSDAPPARLRVLSARISGRPRSIRPERRQELGLGEGRRETTSLARIRVHRCRLPAPQKCEWCRVVGTRRWKERIRPRRRTTGGRMASCLPNEI